MMTNNGNATEDVTIEILSKLPVKCLLRLKCVCKSWNMLVKTPNFVSKHIRNYSNENTRLLANYMNAKVEGPRYALSLYLDEELVDIRHQDMGSQKPISGQTMGPYDGIFCLYGNDRTVLWNPAIKEVQTLPRCRTILPGGLKFYYPSTGFGWDPVNSTYKLVLVRAIWDEDRRLLNEFSHVAVYYLNANCWKDLKGNNMIPYCLHSKFDSTYLKGVFYWLAHKDDDIPLVLSFNMATEMFQEIEVPFMLESTSATLGLFENFFSLLLYDTTENCFDIYVLEDGCWAKQLTVGPLLRVREPLGYWKHDCIFVESSTGQLLLYDYKSREIRDLGLQTFWLKVHYYKESLLTIKETDDLSTFTEIPWHILGQTDEES